MKKKETSFSQMAFAFMLENGIEPAKAKEVMEKARKRKELNQESRKFATELKSDKQHHH